MTTKMAEIKPYSTVAEVDAAIERITDELSRNRLELARLHDDLAKAIQHGEKTPASLDSQISRLDLHIQGGAAALAALKDERRRVQALELSRDLDQAIVGESEFFAAFQDAARALDQALNQYRAARGEFFRHQQRLDDLARQLRKNHADSTGSARIAASAAPGHAESVRSADSGFKAAGIIVRSD